MLISIILGTRPEIIKMSPIIRECDLLGLNYFVLHTGQHYSYAMDRVFFEQLELPEPKYNLDVGSGTHAEQTAKMLIGLEQVLKKEGPDLVLVQGDTNTALAGALTAVKLDVRVGHVEAGLRSYDRKMPEEINRVLVDHSSDFLFVPTENSREVLLGEGISKEKVFVTGNTVVDAVFQNLSISKTKTNVLSDLGLGDGDYFLVTFHRQENVDDFEKLNNIVEGLQAVGEKFGVKIVCPIHPRTKKCLKKFGLSLDCFALIEPLDFLSFLQLESNARLVLTDSGGVQEESCILGVPCITLRDCTERPETLQVGSNLLAGTSPEKLLKCVKIMLGNSRVWKQPFGVGDAAKVIISKLQNR